MQWNGIWLERPTAAIWNMCGQEYRNKSDRKVKNRFAVREKNKPGYGQIKRADTPKIKSPSRNMTEEDSTL